MTPEALAELHQSAFAPSRGWSAAEFSDLLTSPHVHLLTHPHGFALTRTIVDEAELLTLAVDPHHRRKGIADALMADWLAQTPASTAFLEVAADNYPARALYDKHGFAEVSRRKSYYARPTGPPADALLMRVAVTCRHRGKSKGQRPKTG